MTPGDIDRYGGKFDDKKPVKDPTTEQSAAYANRLHEDVVQLTQAPFKAVFTFTTETTAAPQTIPAGSVFVRSQAGTGSAAKPVVTKTGTGLYTATFATTFTDALLVVETLAFFEVSGAVQSASLIGHVQGSAAANIISIIVTDLAGTPTDLTDGTTISIRAT